MKRIFAFAFLLYTCLQATADTWTDNNGIEWSFFVEGREATYVKPVKSVSGEVIIPGEMDDFYTVRTIASSAFSGCSGLTSVTIPSSVTSIGSDAFGGCFNLTSVTIKSRSILSYSFNSSFSLKTLFGSQVKQYNIPDNITSIGSYTFYGCSGLKNVNISSSVASIGDNAFSGCSNLTSVTINSKSLLSNLHYSSSYSLKNIFGNQVEQYIIGDNITNIVSDAFNGCSGLVCLSMGNSVKSIGLDAFYGCTGLNRVIVQDIAAWCNIDFEGYNANPFYYADHLYSDENTEIYELVIPSSVTSIRDMAFRGCSGLTSVIIPSSVTNIGENAFLDCTGLQKVIVQDISAWSSITFENEHANPLRYSHHLYSDKKTEIYALVIPNGVTSISSYAFYNCSALTSVKIPSSVTSVGSYAFYNCSTLTSVDISSNLTIIDSYAFYGCSGLTSMEIPSCVRDIGSYAFSGCSGLTSVNIPLGVTSIKEATFSGCKKLTNVTIPNSVTIIGVEAFSGCYNLSSIILQEGLETIAVGAFSFCKSLHSVVLPNSVSRICGESFGFCSSLTSFTISESVNYILDYPFISCNNLTSLIIKRKTPIRLDNNIFGAFADNATLYVPIGCKKAYESANYWETFKEIVEINMEDLSEETIVPATLSIEDFSISAGETKEMLIDLNNPDTEATLVQFDLRLPTGLSIAMENGEPIVDIAGRTTWRKHSLQTNDLGGVTRFLLASNSNAVITGTSDAIISIMLLAGSNFNGGAITLEEQLIVAPDASETYPDDYTYSIVVGSVPPANNIIFADAAVKALCVENWDTNGDGELSEAEATAVTDIGTVFQNNTQITSFDEISYFTGLTSIASQAFNGCTGLTSITIPENITSIGMGAFKDCTGLTKAEFASLEDLCSMVFEDYGANPLVNAHHLYINGEEITELVIPNSVTTIGTFAFRGCSSLTSATIPNSVTEIGDGIFSDCTALASVSLPENLTKISVGMFYGCKNLASIIIPEGVTSIGRNAFYGCSSLTSLTIPEGVTSIEDLTFFGCSSLTSLTIPEGVTSIGSSAFRDCSCLTFLTIPEGVTIISGAAFKGCSSLTSLTIPEGVTSIGLEAFNGCSSLTSLTIPEGVTSIGSSAFNGCPSLTSVYVKMETPPAITSLVFSNRANATLYVPYGCSEAYEATAYWNEFKKIVEMGAPETDIAAKVGMVLPWGTEQAWEMKYMFFVGTDSEPEADGSGHAWYEEEYDDESWETLSGPIANISDWFSSVNTLWNTEGHESSSYCLRRTFHLDEVDEQGYTFLSQHDDDLKVWINGELVVDAGFDGTLHCHHIPASAFHEGDNTLAISVNDFGGEAFLDYSLGRLFFLQNVETGKYLNAGNEWGTHAVLADEPLPVQLYKQLDGSYTIFFPVGSYNQHLLFMDESMSDVYVDYAGQEASACPYWNITDAGNGNYYIQMLNESDTYLGNDPDREPDNDVDGDVTSGKNITWTLVPEGLHTQAQAERLQELITQANALHIDTNKAQAVLDDENSTYTEMLAQILQVDGWINEGIWFEDEKVKELCVANWDRNEDGELSRIEAGAVTDLGEVFKGNSEITSFNELQHFTGLTAIGDRAFSESSHLTSVQLPEGLERIGESAFDRTALETIQFPSTLTSVGATAFQACENLTSIDFNGCTATIEGDAFSWCPSLTEVVIPSNITLTGWFTFAGCRNLKTLIIEEGNPSENLQATFAYCFDSSLETVVLPSTAIMGENMFEGCSKLKSVTFLNGDPGEKHFANNFQGVPDDVLFVIPEGTAENYLKRGYRNLSDKGALGKVRELFENQVNRISNDIVANVADGDKDALNAAISAAREIVEIAEDYMTIYQQIDAVKDAAKAYLLTATLNEDLDVTGAMITNPDNDYFDIGWTIGFLGVNNGWQNANYSNEDCTIDSFVESWRPGEALSDGRHSQTIKNLPAGKYRLDVKAIASWQDDPEQEVTGVSLFLGDQSTPLATANEKPQFFSVEFTNAETQDVEMGLKVENTTANWVALDDVRLYLRVGRLPGDANGDGYVTIADVMAVVDYILGNTPKDFDFDAANVNNDEVITIADAVSLVNMILEMP